jgi:hypothetical protein
MRLRMTVFGVGSSKRRMAVNAGGGNGISSAMR